ncbi:Cytochrome c2 iso-2 [Magnetospirillum molischianum DSM 120]|uniref:Cytochrome c2 iso-2 n=2 Tax=Magnetospirillum molischianum TaxID=1083 RepID=H8FWY1_MAGML|nr:Cytochrome c2 iso-2 [Magnetospirillum molischianum DSM 120]
MRVNRIAGLVFGAALLSVPSLVSAADAPAAFTLCKACHSVDAGKNGVGPSLAGVFGRKAGTMSGFKFSDPHIKSGLTWDEPTLTKYLADPKTVIPGNKMVFAGLKSPDEIKSVIEYLKTLK